MIVLNITPTRFVASEGKLDSNFRYIFQSNVSPLFVFPIGKTMDLPLRGIVNRLPGISQVVGTNSSFSGATINMRV